MNILFFIIIFIVVIILFFLAIFGRFISAIFSLFRRNKSSRGRGGYSNGGYQRSSSQHTQSAPQDEKKVFSKDEGEYVNFEELD